MEKLTILQKLLVDIKRANWATVKDEEIANLEAKNLEVESKANEVYHTTNTGYGEELIPGTMTTDPVIDMVYKTNNLLSRLPWNHWTGLNISELVPVIGEATLMRWNTEYTTWVFAPSADTQDGPATWKVTITQAPFIAEYFMSDRQLNYWVGNLESIARQRLSESANRTINAYILNADTAASWNVNDDGWTPATTLYYKQGDNGIRKLGIANTAIDLSTLSDGDFLTMINGLWQYASQTEDLLFLSPVNVATKAMGLDSVKTIDKFGAEATIKSWVFQKIFGIDNMTLRDFPTLTLATWKVHTSTWNNFGSIALIYTPAVQYGFGKTPEYASYRIVGKGTMVVAAIEFGFAIANQTAWLDKTVVLGVNIQMS